MPDAPAPDAPAPDAPAPDGAASAVAAAVPAAAVPAADDGVPERSHREILVVMSGLMIAMLLAMLDNMIVAPALPTIVGELGGLEHLAWVTTAYILGTTVATPIWGKLGDLFSRKTIFLTSIVIFLVGSALCGAARGMGELITYRTLQGVGAGGLVVSVMSVLAVLVPPRDRGRYTGYFMAIMPIAMVGGPLVGGFITDHASWRWAFYVNLPIGAVALAVVAVTMKLPHTPRKVRLDWAGAGLMTAWISALVLVTTWGGTRYDWASAPILGLAALALGTFAAFIFVERRVPEPVLPLGVFRNLNFTLAVALGFVVGFAMYGGMTFLPQFQQFVQGESATSSGLLLLPMMAGILITSTLSGQYVSRTGRYKVFPVGGALLMTAGLALFALLDVGTNTFTTGVDMFVMGAGMGCLMQITMLIAQNSVPLKDIGAATAASTFLRSMGGSIGVSMLGALYANRLQDTLSARLGEGADTLGDSTELTPAVVRGLEPDVVEAVRHAITDGITGVFAWSAVVSVAGIAVAVFIKEVPLRGGKPKAAPSTAPAPAPAEPVAAAVPVAGRVREPDGTPLPAAVLTLLAADGTFVGTGLPDAAGEFRFEAGPGTYVLVGSAQGFAPAAVEVPAGGPAVEVVLRGLPAPLAGVVRDAAGRAVDGATVAVTDLAGALAAATRTRGGGRYALAGLAEGDYTLVLAVPGAPAQALAVTVPAYGSQALDVVLDGVAVDPAPQPKAQPQPAPTP